MVALRHCQYRGLQFDTRVPVVKFGVK